MELLFYMIFPFLQTVNLLYRKKLNDNKVSGWGDLENVSNPYTPQVDGVMRIYYQADGNNNATIYVQRNGMNYFYGSAVGGARLIQFFPAKAGNTYQGFSSQPGTIQLAFMPLQKG